MAAVAARTSTAGDDTVSGLIGVIGAIAIAVALTTAAPVANRGRIEAPLFSPDPE
jgi:hypothetical protein